MPHLAFTLLAALLLSVALALLGDRPPRERAYAATYQFFCCVVAAIGGSWVMYLIHR